jgi:deoxyribose-phosphate aldolase
MELNKYIDHSLLKPQAGPKQFETLLDEAVKYQFAAVCVSPHMAAPCKSALLGEDIKVATVVSFPHGNLPFDLKLQEVQYFVDKGIDEIDFVMNYGDFVWKNFNLVAKELITIGDYCADNGATSKCIVEACFLDLQGLGAIFNFIKDETRIDFIKTSTGFSDAGALVDDVAYWNKLRGDSERPLIKAAGYIKTLDEALALIEAGADRIGISASVKVMEEWNARNQTFTGGEETT